MSRGPGTDRPRLFITSRHRPHEVVFLALAVAIGLAYTLGAPPPRSAAAAMPPWLVYLWAAGLAAHGILGLAGVYWPSRDRGLLLELGSMLIGAGALAFVAILTFAYAGWGALLGGGLCVAWAVANLARAAQIRADLRALR